MARLKDLISAQGGSTTNLFNVPIDLLDANPGNIRFDGEPLRKHVRAIADDILAYGYDRNSILTIREIDGRAQVQDGNCLLMAVRLAVSEGAEIKTLPCTPETKTVSEADRIVRMATRNQGLPHTAEEYAAIINKLQSYGWDDAEIAKRLQRSRQWLANIMDLASSPADVKAAVAEGTVSAIEAVKLVRKEGANAGAVIAEAAKTSKSGRVTARHLKPVATPINTPQTPAQPVISDLAVAVTDFLILWDSDGVKDFRPAVHAMRLALQQHQTVAAA